MRMYIGTVIFGCIFFIILDVITEQKLNLIDNVRTSFIIATISVFLNWGWDSKDYKKSNGKRVE